MRTLVVGGTKGIGHAMACNIAAKNATATVIISGRTAPQTLPHKNMEFRRLDATSMREVKTFTDALKASLTTSPQQQKPGQTLDLLILTQGILSLAGRTETPTEGIDRKMALHYYSRQLLIRELLPILSHDAKVIIVLDARFGNPRSLIWDDLDLKRNFGLAKCGQHTMVMNDVMVQYFAAEEGAGRVSSSNDGVDVDVEAEVGKTRGGGRRHFIHAFPGAVDTGLMNSMPWILRMLTKGPRKLMLQTPEVCAENLLNGSELCAAARGKEGIYWSNIDQKGRVVANRTVFNEDERRKIAEHTWEIVDEAIEKNNT